MRGHCACDMRDRAAVLVLPLLLGRWALQHYQSNLSDSAIEARQFDALLIIFLVVCAIMYLLVIGFCRRPRRSPERLCLGHGPPPADHAIA